MAEPQPQAFVPVPGQIYMLNGQYVQYVNGQPVGMVQMYTVQGLMWVPTNQVANYQAQLQQAQQQQAQQQQQRHQQPPHQGGGFMNQLNALAGGAGGNLMGMMGGQQQGRAQPVQPYPQQQPQRYQQPPQAQAQYQHPPQAQVQHQQPPQAQVYQQPPQAQVYQQPAQPQVQYQQPVQPHVQYQQPVQAQVHVQPRVTAAKPHFGKPTNGQPNLIPAYGKVNHQSQLPAMEMSDSDDEDPIDTLNNAEASAEIASRKKGKTQADLPPMMD